MLLDDAAIVEVLQQQTLPAEDEGFDATRDALNTLSQRSDLVRQSPAAARRAISRAHSTIMVFCKEGGGRRAIPAT